VWRFLRHLCFWANNGGGGFKNVKKLKKKLQKVFKRRKKRTKKQKIEKNDAKRRAYCDMFSNLGIFLVFRGFRSGRSRLRLSRILKWVRFCWGKLLSQNEDE